MAELKNGRDRTEDRRRRAPIDHAPHGLLAGAARRPARAAPPDLLADCFTLLPAETPDRSRLHDIGERIARVSGIEATSLTLSEVPGDTLIGVASKWLDRTLETGVPVVDEGEFEDRHGAHILYRATLLPLADEQDEVVQVLGGARCKASAGG